MATPAERKPSTRKPDLPRDPKTGQLVPGTSITEAEADEIIEAIETGASATAALAPEHLPSLQAWYRAMEKDAVLRKRYHRACEVRADTLRETALSTVLDLKRDGVTSNEINASRAILDGIKWVAAVTKPHVYAPKAQVEHGGKIETGDQDPRELAKAVLAALGASALTGVAAIEADQEGGD